MAYQNITPVRLTQDTLPQSSPLPTSATKIIYRAPVNSRTYVKDIDIANTTGTSINVSVFIVPSGVTNVSSGNALFYSVPIPGYSTLQWTGAQILNPSDTIQVSANNTGCAIVISGGEAT